MTTPLQRMKLERFEQRHGKLTKDEAFQLAVESEQIAKDCGPFDIAYAKFAKDASELLNHAELLERIENDQTQS